MSVYSITCGELTYYGSTTQPLCQRKAEHKYAYTHRYGKYRSSMVYDKAKETNSKVIIAVVEDVDGTQEELLAKENWFIANNECVNKKPITLEEKNERRRQKYLDAKKKSSVTI
jgi:hypothetical protein